MLTPMTPIICADSASGSWVSFAGPLSQWMVQPLLVIPVFVCLFGAVSLLPKHRMRRLCRRGTVTLALIYLVGIFPITVNLAEAVLKKSIPQDPGVTADAVVILGRGGRLNPSRAEVAAHLWQEHRAPLIFASGIFDAPKLLSILHGEGIPDQSLQGEDCSRTTYENARYTADWLKPQGIQRILLVTDGPHMLRSLLTFRGFGFEVIPVPSPGMKSLDRTSRTRLVLREYLGLVSYGLLGRFSEHENSRAMLSTPQVSVSQKQEIVREDAPQISTGGAA